MAQWVKCQNCHGNGKIKRILNGKTTEEICTACGGSGKINLGLL